MNIYIHIPFCQQKCTYCKFAITPVFDDYKKKKYLHFLENEIKNTLVQKNIKKGVDNELPKTYNTFCQSRRYCGGHADVAQLVEQLIRNE